MNRTTIPFLCTLLLLAPEAFAAEGFYIGGGPRFVNVQDMTSTHESSTIESSIDTALGGAIQAGYDFDPFRLEAEVSYSRHNILTHLSIDPVVADKGPHGSVKSTATMVNVFYAITYDSAKFTEGHPYIMAGAGQVRLSLDGVTLDGAEFADDHDLVFAFQAGIGIEAIVGKHATLDIGYRYFDAEDPEFKGGLNPSKGFETEYNSHSIVLGLRYTF